MVEGTLYFFLPIKVVPNIRRRECIKNKKSFSRFNAILPVSLRLENSNSLMYEESNTHIRAFIEQKYVYLQRLTGEMVRDIESVFCFILRSKSGQFWYLEG